MRKLFMRRSASKHEPHYRMIAGGRHLLENYLYDVCECSGIIGGGISTDETGIPLADAAASGTDHGDTFCGDCRTRALTSSW